MALLPKELLDQSQAAATQGFGVAGDAAQQDFLQLAAQKTGMLQDLMAPQQERDTAALEAQLLAQGRLGSTGGALQQQALAEAQARANMEAQLAGLDLARQTRLDEFGMGTQLASLGGGFLGQEASLGLQSKQLDLARQRFEWEKKQARRKRGGFLGNLLKAAAGPLATAAFGPLGGFISSQVTGMLGGTTDPNTGRTTWGG